jgi:polysaccharide biosynthesis transport protein
MNANQQELSLRDYWRIVVRRKWVVVAALVACVGGSLTMSFLQDPVYEAQARMAVRTLPGDSIFGSDYLGYSDPKRAIDTEIQVLQSDLVVQRVKQNLGMDTDPPGVQGGGIGSTDVISATVRSGIPATAQVLADAYVQAYIDVKRGQIVAGLTAASAELERQVVALQEQISGLDQQVEDAPADQRDQLQKDLADQRAALVDQQAQFKERLNQMQIDAALSSGGAQLVQPASLPSEPVEPTPARTAALALVVGLLLGLGAVFLLDYADDTVRSSADLERAAGGVPVLAVVPTDPPPDNRPISISRPSDFAVEAYRTLRTNLQFLALERPMKVIQVTSALPGEGKTTTAGNLAVVLAQAGQRVVLVDADLRRPRLHEVFALDGSRGLTDALLGEHLELLLHELPMNGGLIAVLPSGRVPANPSELLGGGRMRAVLRALGENYDTVIVDSAPVLPVTDSVVLSGSVDALVLVAHAGRTSTKQVIEMTSRLDRVSAPVVGVVMNRVAERKLRSGGYGYGYGYGYSAKPGDHEPVTVRSGS